MHLIFIHFPSALFPSLPSAPPLAFSHHSLDHLSYPLQSACIGLIPPFLLALLASFRAERRRCRTHYLEPFSRTLSQIPQSARIHSCFIHPFHLTLLLVFPAEGSDCHAQHLLMPLLQASLITLALICPPPTFCINPLLIISAFALCLPCAVLLSHSPFAPSLPPSFTGAFPLALFSLPLLHRFQAKDDSATPDAYLTTTFYQGYWGASQVTSTSNRLHLFFVIFDFLSLISFFFFKETVFSTR